METHHIALIAGDGIGGEVTLEAKRVLKQVASKNDFQLDFESFPWGSEFFLSEGRMMPEDALAKLEHFDAIFLGAVGDPRVPDHVTLGGLLLPIRRSFKQYANVRPSYLFQGVPCPLSGKSAGSIDCVVVRENTEGEYAPAGGRIHTRSREEVAVQTAIFTAQGTERIVRYAFQLAQGRTKKKLTSVTKSNAQAYSMTLWDEVFKKVSKDFPGVETESLLVDAASMKLILKPESFDVLVASNLFGDILSEITAAVTGSLGLAPSANINPEKDYPSMFEPVHGSAPDIAGQGISNPIAALLAGKMMLEHLEQKKAAEDLYLAIQRYLEGGRCKTPDLGGDSKTNEVADELIQLLDDLSSG